MEIRSPQLELETLPAQYYEYRRGEEEVYLLSPWRMNKNIDDKKKEPPSLRFIFPMDLPIHPTNPPGIHDMMKEEGPYSHGRDEVKLQNHLLQHLESLGRIHL
ncbi:hypothetical protein O181_068080 [Austropuccinia psidii MF-1]|uniref:Uncharacterized protein n=1 Tax=Austropuccinia psidii MF-1 TaxID=1389203 RepID=A0A9Q3F0B6_9BASI|nr:hypothetical protein [Austropuccinia psidii MF-1]